MNLKLRLIKGIGGAIMARHEPEQKPFTLTEQIAEAAEELQFAEATYNECSPVHEEICFYWMKMQQARLNQLIGEARGA